MMTEQAYIAAYQKLSGQYNDNQSTMEEYLTGMQNLKEQYLKGKSNTTLPVVP
ncbi:MAG TPA: hypothetical protein VK663_03340 [Burkholderiales bacterium]|nr:hypothetical protein [Burkholderiales bacterium]